jgi:hypothetical protein
MLNCQAKKSISEKENGQFLGNLIKTLIFPLVKA